MVNQRHPSTDPPSGREWRRGILGHSAAFWAVAAAFLVATSFTVVTTPLWSIYQVQDHFSTFMITVAFSSYAVGVLVSLFLAGHVSDWMGRRTIALPALLLEAVAAVGFIFWNDLPGLIVARFVTGLGLGMFTATATAHLAELHSRARPNSSGTRADVVATAANIGGFGAGVLVTSALVQFAPAPTTTPFVVFLILLLLAAAVVALAPETVTPPAASQRYRPQRVQVPATARTHYLAAAGIAFAAFAVLGLFTSLAPTFIENQLHYRAPLVAGSVVFATFTSAAGLQIGVRRLSAKAAVLGGAALYVGGLVAVLIAVTTASLPLFLLGGLLAGGAAGVLFSTAISAGGQAAAPEHRGEALAGIFLSGYAGLALPVIGLGAATLAISMTASLAAFAVLVVAIAVTGAVVFVSSSPRPRRPE